MFAIVDALLLHPVPYPNPETLVFVWNHDWQGVLNNCSAANFIDWRAQAKSLYDFAAWIPTPFVVTGLDRPRQLPGAQVTANFLHTLGVKPALGRSFLPDEDGLSGSGVAGHSALISYRFWQEELGGDPNVLGRNIGLDSQPYTIAGVLPADFKFFGRRMDVITPVSLDIHDRDYHNLTVIARRNGPKSRATAEMAVIARSLEQAYPKSNRGWTIEVEDFRDRVVSHTFRIRLLLLSGAVGFVLLIACTNIAALLLARSAARSREIAVRVCLGATGARIAAQLLTESAVLSAAGGALGLGLARLLLRAATSIVPGAPILAGQVEFGLPVVWFTIAVSFATCAIFGLAPAIAAAKPDLQSSLRDSSRGSTASRHKQLLRRIMVGAEAAIAIALLAGAGLMYGGLRELSHADPGFDPQNVLTLRLFLPTAKFDNARALRFQNTAVEKISALPGVSSVAVATVLPMQNNMEVPIDVEGAPPRGNGERPSIAYAAVSPDFFRTFRIPVKHGRAFTPSDDEKAPPVAIINEELAARYFPNQDPLGKRILANKPIRGRNGFEDTQRLEIVGVAGNVKLSALATDEKPILYVPEMQGEWSPAVWFAVRTAVPPSNLAGAVRGTIASIDADQPIEQIGTMHQLLENQFASTEFQTTLLAAFATVAMLLAAVGIYGVNAYVVTQRKGEIGLRMALGATPDRVVREIVGQGMLPTAIGIAIGLAAAIAGSLALRSALVGEASLDPVAFLEATLLLGAVAALACYLPARKATRVDPAVVLRAE